MLPQTQRVGRARSTDAPDGNRQVSTGAEVCSVIPRGDLRSCPQFEQRSPAFAHLLPRVAACLDLDAPMVQQRAAGCGQSPLAGCRQSPKSPRLQPAMKLRSSGLSLPLDPAQPGTPFLSANDRSGAWMRLRYGGWPRWRWQEWLVLLSLSSWDGPEGRRRRQATQSRARSVRLCRVCSISRRRLRPLRRWWWSTSTGRFGVREL